MKTAPLQFLPPSGGLSLLLRLLQTSMYSASTSHSFRTTESLPPEYEAFRLTSMNPINPKSCIGCGNSIRQLTISSNTLKNKTADEASDMSSGTFNLMRVAKSGAAKSAYLHFFSFITANTFAFKSILHLVVIGGVVCTIRNPAA